MHSRGNPCRALGIRGGGLPAGYEELYGIKSTGSQYILTDYVPSSCNITIEAVFTLNGQTTQGIWCSREEFNKTTMTLFMYEKKFRADRNTSTGVSSDNTAPFGVQTTIKVDYKNRKLYIDGKDTGKTLGDGDFVPVVKLAFCASHKNGEGWDNYANIDLHKVTVYDENGEVERCYIPVKATANIGTKAENGLYETVEGKFFSSGSSTGFEVTEPIECTITKDELNSAYIIDVTNGNYALTDEDAAILNANTYANLIKRGDGSAVGMPISGFTGNLIVEEGTFVLGHQYDCGADNGGFIRVCNGATLKFEGFPKNARAITGKTVYTSGSGVDGNGVLYGAASWNSCEKCRFILEGDSLWVSTGEMNYLNFIDLNGHKLSGMTTPTAYRWGLSGNIVTNSSSDNAIFEFTKGSLLPESITQFGGPTCKNGSVKIVPQGDDTITIRTIGGVLSYWPMEIGPNVDISSNVAKEKVHLRSQPLTYKDGYMHGDMTLNGKLSIGNSFWGKGTNAIFNLQGTITGRGSIDIGTGWVNYRTTANDYVGPVTVKRDPSVLSEFDSGIGVATRKAYSATETTLTDSNFDFGGGQAEVKGSLNFIVSEGFTSKMTGGSYTGERTKLSDIRKTGEGTLEMTAGVTVTGRLEVAEGTLRFLPMSEHMPVVGKPGLMGADIREVYWDIKSPEDTRLNYDTVYPHGSDLTSMYTTPTIKGPRTTTAKGYIWNRSSETKNWTFLARHNDLIWLWIDDVQIFSAQRNQDNTNNDVKTVEITPGAHKYVLITTSSNTSSGPFYINWTGERGSLHDSCPIDFQGRGTEDGKNFSASYDPGDGSLFTLDTTTVEDYTVDNAFWLPEIETLRLGSGTTFDAGGYSYSVKSIEGGGTIKNIRTFTIEEKCGLTDEALSAGTALIVEGALKCANGVRIGIANGWFSLSRKALENLNKGITIATAESLEGTPALSDELLAHGGELSLSADGKSLILKAVADRYVRVENGLAKIAFAFDKGEQKKEIRVDIYRDGIITDTIWLGNAHATYSSIKSYDVDGYYFAKATIYTDGANEPYEYIVGMVMKGASGVTLSPKSEKTIADAIAELGKTGGKIYLEPGTYHSTEEQYGIHIETPVEIIGLGISPDETTVLRPSGLETRNRVFTIDNALAAVRNITIANGLPKDNKQGDNYRECSGGNVYIGGKGGTVENCIIKDGSTVATWGAGGGNVAMTSGRLANCTLIGGVNCTGDDNQWIQQGCSIMVIQEDANKSATIENCFITKAGYSENKRTGGAPVGLFGNEKVKMINCTVADNIGSLAGGVVLFCQHNKSSSPKVVNCAFFDNVWTNGNSCATCYVKPLHRNSATPDAAAVVESAFINCAAPDELNSTCLVVDDPLFVKSTSYDYRLTSASPLVNAGVNGTEYGALSNVALDGTPRRSGSATDIGCFEYRESKFDLKTFMIIIR